MRCAQGGLAVSKAAVVARRAPDLRSLRLLPDRSPGCPCLRGGRATALQEPLSLPGPRCPPRVPPAAGKARGGRGRAGCPNHCVTPAAGRRAGVSHPQ